MHHTLNAITYHSSKSLLNLCPTLVYIVECTCVLVT